MTDQFFHALLAAAKGAADDQWRHVGQGAIEDAEGFTVCLVSPLHEKHISMILHAPKVLRAAKKLLDNQDEEHCNALQAAINASEKQL